jgi:hypothetical protein
MTAYCEVNSLNWTLNPLATLQIYGLPLVLKINNFIDNSLPLPPNLRKYKPVPKFRPNVLRPISISSSHLHLATVSGVFVPTLWRNLRISHLAHAHFMSCPSHPLRFDHSNNEDSTNCGTPVKFLNLISLPFSWGGQAKFWRFSWKIWFYIFGK